jgi:hypothetical protein
VRRSRSTRPIRWIMPLVLAVTGAAGSLWTSANGGAPSREDCRPTPIDLGFRSPLPTVCRDAPPFDPGVARLIGLPPVAGAMRFDGPREILLSQTDPSRGSPLALSSRKTPVPEPTSLFLMVVGVLTCLLGLTARRALARSRA